jgi:hypothetical protein
MAANKESDPAVPAIQLPPSGEHQAPTGDSIYVVSWRLAVVILALCFGIFLFGLDTTILGTAIPEITTEFQSLSDVS